MSTRFLLEIDGTTVEIDFSMCGPADRMTLKQLVLEARELIKQAPPESERMTIDGAPT